MFKSRWLIGLFTAPGSRRKSPASLHRDIHGGQEGFLHQRTKIRTGRRSHGAREDRDVSALENRQCHERAASHAHAGPLWLDTVNVPYDGSVDVIMDFTDPVIRGMSVFHGHLLNHEDKGMMAKVLFE